MRWQGRRVWADADKNFFLDAALARPVDEDAAYGCVCDYWRAPAGGWMGRAPNGMLANLSGHKVEEHDDGTITVSPGILVSNGRPENCWHGYLRAGVWEQA